MLFSLAVPVSIAGVRLLRPADGHFGLGYFVRAVTIQYSPEATGDMVAYRDGAVLPAMQGDAPGVDLVFDPPITAARLRVTVAELEKHIAFRAGLLLTHSPLHQAL